MRILFIGDIVATVGMNAVADVLPRIKEAASIDLVLANVENSAPNGKGSTREIIEQLVELGVDYCTSGNHIWWQYQLIDELNDTTLPIIRPANYANSVPGRGSAVVTTKLGDVLLINLLGRTVRNQPVNCPFKTVDEILERHESDDVVATVVDFHTECTSEKVAMGWYLDGRVSAVIGTHTHVPTADTWVMPDGTAYVTDAGMVGPQHSVLGVEPGIIVDTMKYPYPQRFKWVTEGPAVFNSVLIEIDQETKRAKSIERLDQRVPLRDNETLK